MIPDPDLERTALHELLLAWREISQADIGTIVALIQSPGGSVLTVDGTPHARVWQELTRLGMAEMLYSPVDPELVRFASLSFRPTPAGVLHLPRIMIQYDLLGWRPQSFADRASARRAAEPAKRRHPLANRAAFAAVLAGVALLLALAGTGPLAPCFILGIAGCVVTLERVEARLKG